MKDQMEGGATNLRFFHAEDYKTDDYGRVHGADSVSPSPGCASDEEAKSEGR